MCLYKLTFHRLLVFIHNQIFILNGNCLQIDWNLIQFKGVYEHIIVLFSLSFTILTSTFITFICGIHV